MEPRLVDSAVSSAYGSALIVKNIPLPLQAMIETFARLTNSGLFLTSGKTPALIGQPADGTEGQFVFSLDFVYLIGRAKTARRFDRHPGLAR